MEYGREQGEGRISRYGSRYGRREFLARASAGAVGAAALGLSGCGVDFSGQKQDSGGQNPADIEGEFSWRREEGKTINLIFAEHPMADSYIKNLSDFKEKTGIKVNYDKFPEEEFFQKLTTDLSTRQGNYDAFMSGPPNNWQFAAPGWTAPLDAYIDNPSLTEESYDLDDFYPAALDVNRWDPKGEGNDKLWAIPANEEGYSLFYRKDILDEAGIDVPETFDDLLAAAKELNGKKFGGKTISGFVGRGEKTFPTMTGGFSAAFGAYGGRDVEGDKVVINSPETVKAVETWAKLQQYAPNNVGTFFWYDAMNYFTAGNSAFFLDADHMSETFEGEESSVVGKVGYALPPKGDAGRACGVWLWSLAMSANSKNNVAAWLFLQWATSKEQLQRAIPEGNINPTRQSLSNSKTMKKYTREWGGYNDAWQNILADYAKWRYVKSPKFPQLGDRWALAIQEVVLGKKDAQQSLDEAARESQDILDSSNG